MELKLTKTECENLIKEFETTIKPLKNIVKIFGDNGYDGFVYSFDGYLQDIIHTKKLLKEYLEFFYGEDN